MKELQQDTIDQIRTHLMYLKQTDLQNTEAIDISNLESGVYTVNIHSEKGEYVQKLIIQ